LLEAERFAVDRHPSRAQNPARDRSRMLARSITARAKRKRVHARRPRFPSGRLPGRIGEAIMPRAEAPHNAGDPARAAAVATAPRSRDLQTSFTVVEAISARPAMVGACEVRP
jgi:hypothetical protein